MERRSWKCDVCLNDFDNFARISIGNHSICKGCLQEMFEKALKHEFYYPPRLGDLVLHPQDFEHVISEEFITQYLTREAEHKCPPFRRVYCGHAPSLIIDDICGAFLGRREEPVYAGTRLVSKCQTCSSLTCMLCVTPQPDPIEALNHECTPGQHDQDSAEDIEAFKDLERGKHWQLCPARDCGYRIELTEACNHIVCPCGTGFCFLCDKECEEYGNHWMRGGCRDTIDQKMPTLITMANGVIRIPRAREVSMIMTRARAVSAIITKESKPTDTRQWEHLNGRRVCQHPTSTWLCRRRTSFRTRTRTLMMWQASLRTNHPYSVEVPEPAFSVRESES